VVVNLDNFNAFRDPAITYGANSAATMTTVPVRGAPDNDQLWTPSDTYHDTDMTNLGLGLKYKINDRINFRAATAYNEVNREMLWGMMYFTVDPDIYKYDVRAVKFFHKTTGAYAYMDAEFDTGPLEHKLTVGANGYTQDTYNWTCMLDRTDNTLCAGDSRTFFTGSFSNPALANNNNIAQYNLMQRLGPRGHRNNDSLNYNLVIGDSVKIGEQWELMLGLNRSTIRTRNYNATTGVRTSFYEESAVTPTFALMFKPAPNVTAYASYVESLEAGSIVPDNNQWSNRNEVMSPLMSEQYEVGVKAEVGGMFLTAALYQIERALQYGDTARGTWVQDGYQRHRGLELTGRGKIGRNLTLMGGLNFLDAEIVKTNNQRHVGHSPAHVPKFSGKLYAEYALPFVDGLTLTGGLNHFGKSYTTPVNNVELPSYSTGDLGLRLETEAWGRNVIYRLNVNNLTNEKYWYGGGSSHLHLGAPRNMALSAEIQF
jgi:iron complex outermembrane receptor protein